MRADYFAKCPRCGDLISMDPDEDANCNCGSLFKETAGRFGSSFAPDDDIEIYRRA